MSWLGEVSLLRIRRIKLKAAGLTFSTLNLQNFTAPPFASYEFDNIYSQAQWQQKTRWLCRLLQQVQPDVLALQEVFSLVELQQLLQQQGFAHVMSVGTPELVDQHFFRKPVVALASRFPVLELLEVPVPAAAAALGMAQFQFSRPPLRALLQLPGIGPCQCYVVHLKSRRTADLPTGTVVVGQHLPSWAATVQRGNETALLLEAILQQRQVDGFPVVLLGDLNDELSSAALQLLQQPQQLTRGRFRLQDSWLLWPEAPSQRPASHYYGARGSVLDYILLSDEFDAGQSQSIASVQAVEVFDRHLRQPEFAQDGYSSDHAMVSVRLRLAAQS